jgi:hypothetical protein
MLLFEDLEYCADWYGLLNATVNAGQASPRPNTKTAIIVLKYMARSRTEECAT